MRHATFLCVVFFQHVYYVFDRDSFRSSIETWKWIVAKVFCLYTSTSPSRIHRTVDLAQFLIITFNYVKIQVNSKFELQSVWIQRNDRNEFIKGFGERNKQLLLFTHNWIFFFANFQEFFFLSVTTKETELNGWLWKLFVRIWPLMGS